MTRLGDEAADDVAARRPRGGLRRRPRSPWRSPRSPPLEQPSQPTEQPAQARRPVQRLVFGWRLFVGCTPYSCSGTCDKAHAGADFDGVIMRWAVPHFGQKLGVPLSDDKHQAPGQRPGYAGPGFDFDTLRCVVLTQPDKVANLLACLAD